MYKEQVSATTPGLICILIDQSGSMENPYGGNSTRKETAATTVNRCIHEIIRSCKKESEIRPRCQIGVIGYGGNGASLLVSGWVDQLLGKILPRKLETEPIKWVEAAASGGTPMGAAFDMVANLIKDKWLPSHQNSFPPIVINITDGEPTDDAEPAAKRLMSLSSNDGNVLLFNAHISSNNASEIQLPATPPSGTDEAAKYAQFIFRISSPLPPTMIDMAKAVEFTPQAGARGCVFNADGDTLVRLINFGSQKMK